MTSAYISLSVSSLSLGHHSQPDPLHIQLRWWTCS